MGSTNRWWPTALTLIVALLCAFAGAAPAAADFEDFFFGKVRSVAPLHDPAVMAQYTIDYQDQAKVVYDRALTSGYYRFVFFGLIAGVKAVKNKQIDKLGVFTYETCMTPITAYDAFWSKVDSYIDDGAARLKTKGALEEGKQELVKAAKAQTAEEKQAANDAIAEKVPFWKDIPIICHFSFNTDFKNDRYLQQTVWKTVEDTKSAYLQFHAGNVAGGIAALSTLGVDNETVCHIADDALAGGWVDNLPTVGDAVKLGCSKVAGAIINTVQSVGDVLETIGSVTGISDIGDAIAGQTKHIPQEEYYKLVWQPRIGMSAYRRAFQPDYDWNADWGTKTYADCVTYFDSHTMSNSNAHETCVRMQSMFVAGYNDMLGAHLAAKKLAVALETLRKTEGPSLATVPMCTPPQGPSVSCSGKPGSGLWGSISPRPPQNFNFNVSKGSLAALAYARLHGPAYDVDAALQGAYASLKPALIVEENKNRLKLCQCYADAVAFRQQFQTMADDAEHGYIDPWLKKCADDKCRTDVLARENTCRSQRIAAANAHPVDPDMPKSKQEREQAINAVKAVCEADFTKAIDASVSRIAADPSKGFRSVLAAIGCKNFLRREQEQLCPTKSAYDTCKTYVDRNLLRVCLQDKVAGSRYANRFLDDETADPKIRMALWGCKNFLGRADETLCSEDKGFQICKTAADKGLVKLCMSEQSKERYTAAARGQRPPAGTQPASTTAAAGAGASSGAPNPGPPQAGAGPSLPPDCRSRAERPGHHVCTTAAAYAACLALLDLNRAESCTGSGAEQPQKASIHYLEESLHRFECGVAPPAFGRPVSGHTYLSCGSPQGQNACETMKGMLRNPLALHCAVRTAAGASQPTTKQR